MSQTRWTEPALADITAAHAYLSVHASLETASEQLKHIVLTIDETLTRFPGAGKAGLYPGTRRFPVPKMPFIVEYRFVSETLELLRVFHHAQKWPGRRSPL